MRVLGAKQTEQIEHDALRAIIRHACHVAGSILGQTREQMMCVYESPHMAELLARDEDRERFLDLWECCVLDACQAADLLREDEFMIRAVSGFPNGRLVTRIYIYSEADFPDE